MTDSTGLPIRSWICSTALLATSRAEGLFRELPELDEDRPLDRDDEPSLELDDFRLELEFDDLRLEVEFDDFRLELRLLRVFDSAIV